MSDNIVVQDILNRLNDFLSNYTTGSIDLGNRMRGINSAFEYVKRRMTLPSDELVQQILFAQDNIFYPVNKDFNEGLTLSYSDITQNTPAREWIYLPYREIIRMSGNQFVNTNYWSWMPLSGKMQLVIFGRNLSQGQTLSTFDSITNSGYAGLNDAQNLAIDNNILQEGAGSLRFDINPNAGGTGLASIWFPTNFNFQSLMNASGLFKLYPWLATADISQINLLLITTPSTSATPTDYYSMAATAFDDGTAFAANIQSFSKKVSFNLATASVTGSPNIQQINGMRIDFVLGPSFGAQTIANWRVDNLYSTVPDLMDLTYLTSYKGTASDGTTNKIFLTDVSDIPAFASFAPDLIDVIAFRAAVILVPQILSNEAFRQSFKEDQKEIMNIYGKSWPRKRVINLGKAVLSRPR